MAYEFKQNRRVEFSETDLAGIVHYTNFFKYMESAEHAFFRSLGYSIHTKGFGETIGWPRVHAACDFTRPLRFEDVFEVHLLVRKKGRSSLGYTFIFRESGNEVARGTLTVACVRWDAASGKLRPVSIPDAIADQIEVAPKELF